MDDETWEEMRRLDRHDRRVTLGFRLIMIAALISAPIAVVRGLLAHRPHWPIAVVVSLAVAAVCWHMARRQPPLIEVEETDDL